MKCRASSCQGAAGGTPAAFRHSTLAALCPSRPGAGRGVSLPSAHRPGLQHRVEGRQEQRQEERFAQTSSQARCVKAALSPPLLKASNLLLESVTNTVPIRVDPAFPDVANTV